MHFFNVLVNSYSFLDFAHIRVPCGANHWLWGLPKSSEECQKSPKTAKWVIFKGDSTLDVFFSKIKERVKLFWTSYVSGNVIEPNRNNEDFKGSVRNLKKGKKAKKKKCLQLRGQFRCTFFKVLGTIQGVLDSYFVWVTYGTNEIPWRLPRSYQEHPKGLKTANWVIFIGDSSLDALLLSITH